MSTTPARLAGAFWVGLAVLAVAAQPARADESDELVMGQFKILSRTEPVPDTLEIELSATLHNLSSAHWSSAIVTWTGDCPWVEFVQPFVGVGPIAPFDSAVANYPYKVRLPKKKYRKFRKQLRKSTLSRGQLRKLRRAMERGKTPGKLQRKLDKARAGEKVDFEIVGTEASVFTANTVIIDKPTDEAYVQNEVIAPTRLSFVGSTPLLDALVPGKYLMVDPASYGLKHMLNVTFPAEVLAVSTVQGNTQVDIAPGDLFDVVISGTLRGEGKFEPPVGNTIDPEFILDEELFCGTVEKPCPPKPTPIGFRDVRLGGLSLSGELLFRSGGVHLVLKIRKGLLTEASVGIGAAWTATIAAYAEQDLELPATERSIGAAAAPLTAFMFGGIPITVSLGIELLVGAEADFHAETIVGVHQVAEIGADVGVKRGKFFADSFAEVSPVQMSPPKLTKDTAAHGKLWATLSVSVTVNGAVGPFLDTLAFATLDVNGVSEPLWTVEAGVEQIGGFELSLLGVEIARIPIPLWSKTLGSREGRRPPAKVYSGDTVRWAVAVHDDAGSGGHDQQSVTATSDGGVVIGGRTTTAGYLVKFDARGNRVWEKGLPLNQFPVKVAEIATGSIVAAGNQGNTTWLAEYDANGNPLWQRGYDVANNSGLTAFTPFLDAAGNQRYLFLNRVTIGTINERDPCLVCLDETGDVLWAKQYKYPGVDWGYGVTATADGGFVIVGSTEMPVSDFMWTSHGAVIKVDAEGTLEWAHALGSWWISWFADVEEGRNGDIYAVGTVFGVVNDVYPSMWLARLAGDGGNVRHVLATSPGEDTPYDTAFDIGSTPGGFIVSGSAKLGDDREGWVLKITPELAISWMTTHDGPFADVFHESVSVKDGTVVVGSSTSYIPLGEGGSSSLVVLSLPEEGMLRYGAAVNATSRYLPPEAFPSYMHPDFRADSANLKDTLVSMPIPYTTVEAVVTDDPAPGAPIDLDSTVTPLGE